jgi:acetyltransferase-like isoleucine patch superfamily enzyme
MGEGGIKIGNNVLIGPYSQLYSVDHGHKGKKPNHRQRSIYSKIIIEDEVWIGANSIILKGVKIGKGAVIGAGSIVTKNVSPYTIYAGNPAKFIKKR